MPIACRLHADDAEDLPALQVAPTPTLTLILVDELQAGGICSPRRCLAARQVTDLRTLAWQMQFDTATDWRPMLLVAPEAAIAYVQAQQAAAAEQLAARGLELTNADVQGLLFGENADGPSTAASRMRREG